MREIVDNHLEKLVKEKDQKKEEKPIKGFIDHLFENRYQISDRPFGIDESGLFFIYLIFIYLFYYLFYYLFLFIFIYL